MRMTVSIVIMQVILSFIAMYVLVYSPKIFIIDAHLGSKYDTAFTWRLFKRFISLNYFTLKDPWNLLFLAKYLTSFNSSKMLLNIELLNHLTH